MDHCTENPGARLDGHVLGKHGADRHGRHGVKGVNEGIVAWIVASRLGRRLARCAARTMLAGALGFGTHASAASFDCAKAQAADERTVCAHLDLNDQDVRMSTLYHLDLRFLPMGGRDDLRDTQAEWLRERTACGAGLSCLRASYQKRIALLQDIIDTRVATHGPF